MSSQLIFLSLLASAGCRADKGDSGETLPLCSVDAPADTPLHTDGTWIRDGYGRRVTLRGVNTGGRSKFAPYLPFDVGSDEDAAREAYLDRAASWGVTVLRVPFSWAALEPVEGEDDLAWLASYEALLDGAAARGIWTIVDFHQDIYAEPLCGDGFPAWTLADPGPARHDCPLWFMGYFTDDDVKQAFDDLWSDTRGARTAMGAMWTRLAARQAERPGVIGFEILNEPFYGNADPEIWAPEVLTPFYEDMAKRIQEQAPDALIFFDATGVEATAGETSLARPSGENLVFAPHYYDGAVFLGSAVDPDGVAAALARWAALGRDWDLPVLLGEIGVGYDNPSAEPYAAALMAGMDLEQLHATWWEYSDAEENWNEEDFSLIGPAGEEREHLIAAVARPTARALAEADPDGTTWSWDAETRTYTLAWEGEADGISEITLPTWLYGGMASLSGEGGCIDPREDRVFVRTEGGPARLVVAPGG